MAHTGTVSLIPVTFSIGYAAAVADGYDYLTLPFDAVIWRVQMSLAYLGASSGATDVVIERSGTDLWTVGTGIGRIAYNASAKYLEWDWENAGWAGYASGQLYPPTGCRLNKGDTLKLNVDAAAGTAAQGLKLTLWVRPLAD